VAKVATHCPRLENLQLEQCYKITDHCLTLLADSCPSLRFLKVPSTTHGPTQLVTHHARVSCVVCAWSCRVVSCACTVRFVRAEKIRGCNKITAEGLAAFASLLPGCRVLQEKGQRKDYRLVLPDDPLAPLTFL
jgi:hypothetical protein